LHAVSRFNVDKFLIVILGPLDEYLSSLYIPISIVYHGGKIINLLFTVVSHNRMSIITPNKIFRFVRFYTINHIPYFGARERVYRCMRSHVHVRVCIWCVCDTLTTKLVKIIIIYMHCQFGFLTTTRGSSRLITIGRR